jgi:hypothetical protein
MDASILVSDTARRKISSAETFERVQVPSELGDL